LEKTEKEKENKEILAYQDEEIIFNNQTNQLVQFLQDNDTNGDEDEDEVIMCQSLWPIAAPKEETETSGSQRKTPGGEILKGY
jgi:hypothetical protein